MKTHQPALMLAACEICRLQLLFFIYFCTLIPKRGGEEEAAMGRTDRKGNINEGACEFPLLECPG